MTAGVLTIRPTETPPVWFVAAPSENDRTIQDMSAEGWSCTTHVTDENGAEVVAPRTVIDTELVQDSEGNATVPHFRIDLTKAEALALVLAEGQERTRYTWHSVIESSEALFDSRKVDYAFIYVTYAETSALKTISSLFGTPASRAELPVKAVGDGLSGEEVNRLAAAIEDHADRLDTLTAVFSTAP